MSPQSHEEVVAQDISQCNQDEEHEVKRSYFTALRLNRIFLFEFRTLGEYFSLFSCLLSLVVMSLLCDWTSMWFYNKEFALVSRAYRYERLWLRMIHELLLTHNQLGKKCVSEYKNQSWSELRFCGCRDEIKILLIKYMC